MNQSDVPVGIVGAGPVGLACALRLASFGVPSVILEREPAIIKEGSKACVVQRDVLEILDKVGCAETVAAEGIVWQIGRTYVRDKELFQVTFPRTEGFPPWVNISQTRIEEILHDRLVATASAQVLWSHEVTDVSQDGDGVRVAVSGRGRNRELRFAYLVGCDGFHSTVRKLTQAEWVGYGHHVQFLIADIRAELPLARERHFHYDPSANPGRQIVLHAQPNGIWRVDWQLPPGADIAAERRSGELDRRIRAVVGEVPYEIDWLSTYRFHQRVAERLQVGRVFLAGDAAHALPPFGARGMNSGIQDVDNLAWKLALVLNGQAGAELLATYHVERHTAARENLRITAATFKFMAPPNPLSRLRRNALLRLAPRFRPFRRFINSGTMSEPHVYRHSPIVHSGKDPLVGRFAPDGSISVCGKRMRFRELLGSGFVALHAGTSPERARDFAMRARGRPEVIPVQLILAIPPGGEPEDLPEATTVVHVDGPGFRSVYGVDRAYLIRPDAHIAARLDGATLADAVRHATAT